MATQLPTVTRTKLRNGKYRYEVDGEVHTKASVRYFTNASVYRRDALAAGEERLGREVGALIVFLHSRPDLAVKGHVEGNHFVKEGLWSRVPGVVTIDGPEEPSVVAVHERRHDTAAGPGTGSVYRIDTDWSDGTTTSEHR